MLKVLDTTFKALERAINYDTTRKQGYDAVTFLLLCFSIGWIIALLRNCYWLARQIGF